jgi:phage repressor protein C with HTH and peptisase S24 domain
MLMLNGKDLKRIIKELDLTQEEAAKRLGRSRATVITWLGKSELDEEILFLVKTRLGIDLSKFEKSALQEQNDLDQEVIDVNQRNKKKSAGLIPFYNADFIAGNAELYYADETIYPEYYMDVPEFSGSTAFRAFGDSMEPRIKSGNILFGTKLYNWESHLEFGQIYGITCNNGVRYLKYIRRHPNDKTHFLLRSENKDYDDMDMPKCEIKNIWLINGWIDKRT